MTYLVRLRQLGTLFPGQRPPRPCRMAEAEPIAGGETCVRRSGRGRATRWCGTRVLDGREVRPAHEAIESGHTVGKSVLRVGRGP